MVSEQVQALVNELVADGILPENAPQAVDWEKFDSLSLRAVFNLIARLEGLYA